MCERLRGAGTLNMVVRQHTRAKVCRSCLDRTQPNSQQATYLGGSGPHRTLGPDSIRRPRPESVRPNDCARTWNPNLPGWYVRSARARAAWEANKRRVAVCRVREARDRDSIDIRTHHVSFISIQYTGLPRISWKDGKGDRSLEYHGRSR